MQYNYVPKHDAKYLKFQKLCNLFIVSNMMYYIIFSSKRTALYHLGLNLMVYKYLVPNMIQYIYFAPDMIQHIYFAPNMIQYIYLVPNMIQYIFLVPNLM